MDRTHPLLSVIVPAYNRRQYVRLAVLSLLAEGIANLEIIVVDDGSTDGTLDTIRELPLRTVRLELNQGVSAARNAGLRLATGKYVAFLDSDDILVPGGLRWRIEYLECHPEENGVLGLIDAFIDSEGNPHINNYDLVQVYRELGERITLNHGKNGFQFPCPTGPAMFRADIFHTIGYFDESLRLAEDQDFLCRFLKQHTLPVVHKPVYRYRVHNENLSTRSKNGVLHGTVTSEAHRILVLKSHGLY